jgi:hypothetical protein
MPFLFFFLIKEKRKLFLGLRRDGRSSLLDWQKGAGGSGAGGGQVGNSVFCSDNVAVYAKNTTARRAAIKTERERENSKNKK